MASSSKIPEQDGNDVDIEKVVKDRIWYLPLYRAVMKGDWEAAQEFFDGDADAIVGDISGDSETLLHVAAFTREANFVEKLVDLMSPEALAMKDYLGRTAFYEAVVANNIKGVKDMVIKNPNLPQIRMKHGVTPILKAALLGHKDMLWYLCSVTKDENPSPFQGDDGASLIVATITADFYDVALYLIRQYPEMATSKDVDGLSAFHALSGAPLAFFSGNKLGFWQRCIYSWVPVDQPFTTHHYIKGDRKNPKERSKYNSPLLQVFQHWKRLLWYVLCYLVRSIKEVHDEKLKHIQVYELVNCIRDQLVRTTNSDADYFSLPIMKAARNGIVELMDIFIQFYPTIMWKTTGTAETNYSILHVAILNRQEKVFNFIKGICKGACMDMLASYTGTNLSNVLHLVAKLPPPHKLNSITGAALQMQRELQWYKEVEKIVQPNFRKSMNKDKITPPALFTEEHKELLEKGEKWMKDMASSCMVVSTLITTVVFAAAFTVPGGNFGDKGTPIFLKARPFMVFVISDSLALFSSATSVLIFLSILTSRYAEEDFLFSLPRKLLIGLATLFFSILAMMAAFGATFFIMLTHELVWIAIFISFFICLPVTLFAMLQFPLFKEIMKSTYGSKFFH